MVTIEVVRLSVHAFHGVGEQERVVGNDFEVSVSLDYPPAEKAVVTDDLDSTLDYGELIEIIRNVMAIPSRLLEHVCGRLSRTPDILRSGQGSFHPAPRSPK